jgi:hypothetical protein
MAGGLTEALAGVAGGLAGSAFMRQAMTWNEKLPDKYKAPQLNQHPGVFVASQAERAIGVSLPADARQTVANSLHWVYGSFWPTVLSGFFGRSIGASLPRTLAAGAGLGVGVWAVGYLGWLPASHLVSSGTKEVPRQASSALSHAIYGVIALLPLYAFEKLAAPRRRRARLGKLALLLAAAKKPLTAVKLGGLAKRL